MISTCLKNYFHDLKYVFTLLGTFLLTFLFALNSLLSLLNELPNLIETAVYAIFGGSTISDALSAITLLLKTKASAFFLYLLIGLIVGFFLTMIFARCDIEKRFFVKTIFAALLDTVLFCAYTVIFFFIAYPLADTATTPAVFVILAIVFVFLYGILALLSAYLTSGIGRVPLRKVISIKNFILLFIAALIEIGISAAIWTVLALLINSFFVTIVLAALLEVVILSVILNADAYVNSLKTR